tara:strand:- start:26284 stop:28983 length:2700 start_codon:yes stop_codon:yes gene_type:complete
MSSATCLASEPVSPSDFIQNNPLTSSTIEISLSNTTHDRHLATYLSQDTIESGLPKKADKSINSAKNITLLLLHHGASIESSDFSEDKLFVKNTNNSYTFTNLSFNDNSSNNFANLLTELSDLGISDSELPNTVSEHIAINYMSNTNGASLRVFSDNNCSKDAIEQHRNSYSDPNADLYLCYFLNLTVPLQKSSSNVVTHSYLANFEIELILKSNKAYSDAYKYNEHVEVVSKSILDSYIIKDLSGAPIQASMPALNHNSLILSYNTPSHLGDDNVLKSRARVARSLETLGHEREFAWFFNNPSAIPQTDHLLRDYIDIPLFSKKLKFQNTWNLFDSTELRCKNLTWGLKSLSFECLASENNNYWIQADTSNHKLRLSNFTLTDTQNHLLPILRPQTEHKVASEPWIDFDMAPAVMPNVNQYGEYNFPNGGIATSYNSDNYCFYYPDAWNRFSVKNPNLRKSETLGSYIRFNMGESFSTSPSQCLLDDINTKNFNVELNFKMLGHPQGEYHLYKNNDFSIEFVADSNSKGIKVSFGGRGSHTFTIPNRIKASYIWHNLRVSVFSDIATVKLGDVLLGKYPLNSNGSITLNESMSVGMSSFSNGANPISLEINMLRIFNVPAKSLVQQCFGKSKEKQLSLLPVGDSITEGKEVYGGSWRSTLCDQAHQFSRGIDFVGNQKYYKDMSTPVPNDPRFNFDGDHNGHFGQTSVFLNHNNDLNTFSDIVLYHAGTNDIRVNCERQSCYNTKITEHGKNVSNNIFKNIDAFVTKRVIANPNVAVLVAKIIPSNPGHSNVEGTETDGTPIFTPGINKFYLFHNKRVEEWARAYNLKAGRKVVTVVDHEKAMLSNLGDFDLDNKTATNFYNDTLHPSGSLTKDGIALDHIYGTEIMADVWFESLKKL